MLWAFLFGLVMDVHDGACSGSTRWPTACSAFGAISLHRRLPWFNLFEQALQVFPLFVLSHVVAAAVRLMVEACGRAWWGLMAPVLEAVLWLPVSVLLLAPQRRAPDRDAHRPL